MGQFGMGQPLRRVEDQRFITGAGCYTDDIQVEGQACGLVLRSPHAHAEILDIRTEAAAQVPGVLGVFTARDLEAAGIGDIPSIAPPSGLREGTVFIQHDRPVLARDRVRHVGDGVAFVVAETLAQARDAAELIEVEYRELDVCVETARANAPDVPQVWPDTPKNRSFAWEMGNRAETEAAFARAERIVPLRVVNNRIVVSSMEPRVAIGEYQDGSYTLHTASQGVHSLKKTLAKSILNIDPDNLRVVTSDVGGGFGMKIFCYPETVLVLFAARQTGRPVKWLGERATDAFVADTQGRDHVSDAELALDGDGGFLGLRVQTTANLGAYLSNLAPFVATLAGCRMLNGVYRFPAIHVEVTGVYTNTVPVDAYRGAGRPEAIYLLERLIDQAAREIGTDPAELRRKNFIRPEDFPYATPLGTTYDSGLFARTMDGALAHADRNGFAARQAESRTRGKRRGLGIAYYVEACGKGAGEGASIRVDETGHVIVLIGSQCNGQGHRTAYTQIAADRLGIAMEDITVVQGDSARIARGSGTGGSRALSEGGVATRDAAQKVVEKGLLIAAEKLEAAPGDMEYQDGVFAIAGTDRTLTLAEVARVAADPANLPENMEPGLDGSGFFRSEQPTFPNGCHVCELEVDPQTGRVEIVRYTVMDDFGTVVNPLMLAGQVHGGIAQGVGQALLEHTAYDPDSGQLISGSFMDYALPHADDMPFVDFHYHEDAPCLTSPLGVKGAGEAGTVGAPGAVMNALLDALWEDGVRQLDMPATPVKIWRAVRAARGNL